MAILQKTVPLQNGYDFGIGVDLASGTPLDRVVQAAPSDITSIPQAGGSNVSFQVQRISTTSDLERAMNLDVDASYGSTFFGAGASARFNFVKNQKVHAASLFMTVTASIELPFLQIDEPALTADASGFVDRPDIFAQRFGNVFVRGITRGGFFVGVLRVETSSSVEANDIAASLHGTYGLFSADANARFKDLQSNSNIQSFIEMYHEGGPTDLAITDETNPMQLLNNANAFLKSFATPGDAANAARPYQVTLAPITIARGPLPPNEADLEHADDVLKDCARQRSAKLDNLNLLEFIANNSSKFDFSPPSTTLATIQSTLGDTQTDLDTIAKCASAAINHPQSAAFAKDFAKAQNIDFPRAQMPSILPLPASKALDTSLFGEWSNTDIQSDPLRLILERGADPEHVQVTGVFHRFISPNQPPGEVQAIGLGQVDLKTQNLAVRLLDPTSPGSVFQGSHSLVCTTQGTELEVIDTIISGVPGGGFHTSQTKKVFTFRKTK